SLDAILITGDLATSGYRRDDLVMARAILEPAQGGPGGHFVRHPLSAGYVPTFNSGAPVVWMPGNHDRYAGKGFEVGGTDFDEIVGWKTNSFVATFSMKGALVLTIDCSLRPGSGSDSFPHRLGVGEVHDALLAEVRRICEDREPDDLLLWMVHWPPEHTPRKEMMKLVRENELLELAQEFGVDLILSGHTHRASVYESTVGVPVLCCGTTSQALSGDEPHTLFDIHVELESNALTIDVDRWEFDSAGEEEAFVRAPGWRITRSSQGATRIVTTP
ncbi:MAG: metallophosphoesterase, partial [Rhodoglobus sp.]|nr:metallophosphoesterase [Rhodoglobus sp.]